MTRARAALLPGAVTALGWALALAGCGAAPGGTVGAAPAVPSSASAGAPSTSSTASSPSSSGAPGASATAAGDGEVRVPAGGASAPAVPAGLRPVRIQAPAIGLDASLGELGVSPDGSVQVPSDPMQAGWFDRSSVPGRQGPAVVLGHVDSRTGPAVFARLARLVAGDVVTVTRADGTVARFTVDGTMTFAKSDFPTAATYGPVPGPALRLVTCGGAYVRDRGGYQSNVVVFAS